MRMGVLKTMNRRPLVLASGSPRRRDLLDIMGLVYSVDVPDVDEHVGDGPEETVLTLSMRKAQAVAARHRDCVVIAADTVVYDGRVLGKPGTAERAAAMLRELSGRWHDVYTGLTVVDAGTGKTLRRAERTRVHFVEMTPEEIEAYAASGEPLDKAGAYAIQGRGGMFIDRIEGSYSNVIGLPTSALRELLARMDGDAPSYE